MFAAHAMHAVSETQRKLCGGTILPLSMFEMVCENLNVMGFDEKLKQITQMFTVLEQGKVSAFVPTGNSEHDARNFMSLVMGVETNTDDFETNLAYENGKSDTPYIEEGFMSCQRCRSKRIKWTSSHCRSMDEGMTIFAECSMCSKRWKIYS